MSGPHVSDGRVTFPQRPPTQRLFNDSQKHVKNHIRSEHILGDCNFRKKTASFNDKDVLREGEHTRMTLRHLGGGNKML